MKKINIFCFGFGQIAKNFIKKINSENIIINLTVTSRKRSEIKIFDKIKYESFQFSKNYFDQNLIKNLESSDYILASIAPIEGEDIVIKSFQHIFKKNNIKWITYLSATSVYGNHKGDWVNENSETKPTSPNGLARLKAENSWLALKMSKNLPVQIFRLSGIYSNERNILVRLKLGTAKLINKKNHFFSRIHVEDIASILFVSLSKFKSGEIYNIADDKPSSSEEIMLHGAKMLNIKNLKKIEVKEIESEMLKNFYKDSKRVSNKKMKNYFGYNFKFPTYIEGLDYIRDNFI